MVPKVQISRGGKGRSCVGINVVCFMRVNICFMRRYEKTTMNLLFIYQKLVQKNYHVYKTLRCLKIYGIITIMQYICIAAHDMPRQCTSNEYMLNDKEPHLLLFPHRSGIHCCLTIGQVHFGFVSRRLWLLH